MSLDISKHKNLLIRILKDIFTDTTVGPLLGFKGGTAAYLFYNLSRFSVDLDFDLLDKGREQVIFERIRKILESYGSVKKAEKKRFNLFFLLSYKDKEKGAQNIKVEINRRAFGSSYEVKAYLGISMKVMVKPDMAAQKLVAMYERIGRTNRDIYDVWFFFNNNWPINKELVEQRVKKTFKKFLEECIDLLSKMSSRNILSGIGELLDKKQKVWVKQKLLDETIFLLKLMRDSE
ncbi:nucleotidyl transferase AbiEii/AbiGii toxin family protein [Candidatus Margulisiibacteriota bacterium]